MHRTKSNDKHFHVILLLDDQCSGTKPWETIMGADYTKYFFDDRLWLKRFKMIKIIFEMVFDEIGALARWCIPIMRQIHMILFLFVHRAMYLVNVLLKYLHVFLLEKSIYLPPLSHMFMYILRYYTHHAVSIQSGFNF